MKKMHLLELAVVGTIVLFLVVPFSSARLLYSETSAEGRYRNQAGQSDTSHLYLYEKNSSTWEIIEGGAWGKMTYSNRTGKFVFNGHSLAPEENYELIYYKDPWNGQGSLSIGLGSSDKDGNVHVAGNFDFTSIPEASDPNYPGAKIWLVLDSDFVLDSGITGHMNAWNPQEYLFEHNLI